MAEERSSTINQAIWDAWAAAECDMTGHRAAQIALDTIGYAALLDVAEAAHEFHDAMLVWTYRQEDTGALKTARDAGTKLRAAQFALGKIPQVYAKEEDT